MYGLYKLMFRMLTGSVMRTGNFAVFYGSTLGQIIGHPYFDVCYSSTLLNLKLPMEFVPCERGPRYGGESHMNFVKLVTHGLRMLIPFSEVVTVRLLLFFVLYFGTCLGLFIFSFWYGVNKMGGYLNFPVFFYPIFVFLFIGGAAGLVLLFMLFFQSHVISMVGIRRFESPKSD